MRRKRFRETGGALDKEASAWLAGSSASHLWAARAQGSLDLTEFRLWGVLLPLVATAALIAACGDSGGQPAGSTVPPSRDETHGEDGVPVVHVSTRWISDNASDLATLARSVDAVFVGSVAESTGERFESAIQPTPETGGAL